MESWDLQRAITFARTVLDDVPDLLPVEVRERYDLLEAAHGDELGPRPRRLRPGGCGAAAVPLRGGAGDPGGASAAVGARCVAQGAQARTGGAALLAAFDERLPFELTAGQRAVGAEIEADLAEAHPMNRLLQGEVGSGKTLVALRAMLRVVDSGGQAALLAPTEVLAQQHHRSITAMLGDLAAGGMLGGAARRRRRWSCSPAR